MNARSTIADTAATLRKSRNARRGDTAAACVAQATEHDESALNRKRQWVEENRAAIQSWNDYVEKHGLPLAGMFEP